MQDQHADLVISMMLIFFFLYEQFGMTFCSEPSTLADIDWDNLGFGLIPTDYMYTMKCVRGEGFSKGELRRYGNIEISPAAGVLNYGQVSNLILIPLYGLRADAASHSQQSTCLLSGNPPPKKLKTAVHLE